MNKTRSVRIYLLASCLCAVGLRAMGLAAEPAAETQAAAGKQAAVTAQGQGDVPDKTRDEMLLEGLEDLPGAGGLVPPDQSRRQPGQRVEIDGSDVGEPHPLRVISQQMRQVELLLNQREITGQTLQSQQQIVTELDQLIAQLSQSRQQKQTGQRQPSAADPATSEATGDTAAQRPGAAADQGVQSPLSTVLQPGGEGVWGHLPERFRGQLRSAEAIEFLPKYRKLIEDYYKRLAEDRGIPQ